ncbi:TNFAIP3-interacting protein 1 [Oryzias melastigma]|uniref:TNFAIP3-interacting protein 1 n=1 Tax=Oryzias melastigma TaxID=30732 RepID=A0A834C620_ORYME|nr:TNFAIP3-interacting protein 1 [Oryzias melastigma]
MCKRKSAEAAVLHNFPQKNRSNLQDEGASGLTFLFVFVHQCEEPLISMKAQILLLEEQRKELLLINKKWAKEYRSMVQYYKQKVKCLSLAQHQDSAEEEKRVTFDLKKTGGGKAAEEEAEELRLQNSTLTRRGQQQHEEIRRLNKALEEALRGSESQTLPDVWKHQAEVYKEDFLKERRDREILKEKYLELEKRSRRAHEELRLLKSQVTRMKPAPTCSCGTRAKSPDWDVCSVNQQHKHQRRYTADEKIPK